MSRESKHLLITVFSALVFLFGLATGAQAADKKPLASKNPVVSVASSPSGTLQTSVGKWSRATGYDYQWYSCTKKHAKGSTAKPTDCSLIAGANSKTYKVTRDVLGGYLVAGVTGKNKYGKRVSFSASTPNTGVSYIREAPSITGAASLSGAATTGSTLTLNLGTYAGYPAPTAVFDGWFSCTLAHQTVSSAKPDDCTLIAGATRTSAIALNQAGKYLLAKVTAASTEGSVSQFTASTSLVTSPVSLVSEPALPDHSQPDAKLLLGDSFTATAASWSGVATPTVSSQWYRCLYSTDADSSLAVGCTAILNATSTTYSATLDDLGLYLVYGESAANSVSTATFYTASSAIVESAPVHTATTSISISGTSDVGETLTAHVGSWYGYPEPQFSYKWLQCTDEYASEQLATTDALPTSCTELASASGSTLLLTQGMFGDHLIVAVTATNSVGSKTYYSPTSSQVQVSPTMVLPPALAGTAKVGSELTASAGSWDANPTPTYAYQWYVCDTQVATAVAAKPTDCTAIDLATGSKYTALQAQTGKYLTFAVTVGNDLGSKTLFAPSVSAVASAPFLISGADFANTSSTVKPNATAVAGSASWQAYPPATLSYEWYDCTDAQTCDLIANQTSSSFNASAITNGHLIKFKVIATNDYGSASTFSSSTSVVKQTVALSAAGSVSGTPTAGQTLSFNTGSFAGYPAPTLANQWFLCTSAPAADAGLTPAGCSALTTDSSISVLRTMQDKYLAVLQTATNDFSTAKVWVSSAKITAAPLLTTAPAVTGTPLAGNSLSASSGAWSGSATISYSYLWYQCTSAVTASDTQPAGCSPTSTTGNSYSLTSSDTTKFLSVKVTATNSAGSTSTWSASSTVVNQAVANTVAPAVTGSALAGSTLTVSDGTWTGYPTPALTYQWYSCTASVASSAASLAGTCTSISLATAATFSVTSTYANKYLLAAVTATNNISTPKTVYSASSTVIKQAPANTVAPAITGTASAGSTLTASTGTWSGTGTISYSYLWYTCSATKTASGSAPTGCTETGTTTSSFSLTSAQAGAFMLVRVTATNDVTSTGYWSASTAAVTSAPANTVAPSITGSPLTGSTLTAVDGTWTGYPTPTLTYAWYSCTAIHATTSIAKPADCTAITNATSSTYLIPTAQATKYISVAVTATNSVSAKPIWSISTALITRPVANSTAPSISSNGTGTNPVVGDDLTANPGTWSGTATIGYTYRWFSCLTEHPAASTSLWNDCTQIPNETTDVYSLVDADVTKYITVGVLASNGYSSLEEFSATTIQIWQLPTAISPPAVTGSLVTGTSVTVSDGVWDGYPTPSTSINYEICSTLNVNSQADLGYVSCKPANINNGTLNIALQDVSKYLRATVFVSYDIQTFVNVYELGQFTGKPAFGYRPALSGRTEIGQVVSVQAPQVLSVATLNPLAYRWFSCATTFVDSTATVSGVTTNCTDVTGGTANSSHTLVSGDAGRMLYAVVTASNSSGSVDQISTPMLISAASASDVTSATQVATFASTPTCSGSATYTCAMNLGDARYSKTTITAIGGTANLTGQVLFDQTLDQLSFSVTNTTGTAKVVHLNRKLTDFDGCGGTAITQGLALANGETKSLTIQLGSVVKFDSTKLSPTCTGYTGTNPLLWAWLSLGGDTVANATAAFAWPINGPYGYTCVMNVKTLRYTSCADSTPYDPALVDAPPLPLTTNIVWDSTANTLNFSITNPTASAITIYYSFNWINVGLCRPDANLTVVSSGSARISAGSTFPSKATTYAVPANAQFDFANDAFVSAARNDCSLTTPGVTPDYNSILAVITLSSSPL